MNESTTFPDNDWRSRSPLFSGETFRRNLATVRELARWAAERGHTVSQLAIAWTLAHPAVHAAIVGSRRPEHIEDSAGAVDLVLTPDDLAEIERMMSGAVAVSGPTPEGV
jgi:aryl-alcohol dehydrogenase-like predicted oxidoreductase